MLAFLGHSVRYTLITLGVAFVFLILAMAIAVEFYPQSRIASRIQDAMIADDQNDQSVKTDISLAFRNALQSEVREKIGTPIEGYEPSMFLQVFPGLAKTDFEGVEASIGYYTIKNGELVHELDPTRLVHSAAGAVTNRGMDTLLQNVSMRLKVDLSTDGTLTRIIEALAQAG